MPKEFDVNIFNKLNRLTRSKKPVLPVIHVSNRGNWSAVACRKCYCSLRLFQQLTMSGVRTEWPDTVRTLTEVSDKLS